MKTKKLYLFIMLILSLLFLSGCQTFSGRIYDLMAAPEVNENQQEIYSILGINSNPNIQLVYPENGDYRSAIISVDFTDDGINDAIGFTRNGNNGAVTATFMTQKEGSWEKIKSFTGSASQIDKILLGDVSGNGKDDIIIGWGSTQNLTATATMYIYYRENVSEFKLNFSYNEIFLTDFTEDGKKEVFTASLNTLASDTLSDRGNATVRVYSFSEDHIYTAYSAELLNKFTGFTNIFFGLTTDGRPAVAIDGVTSDNSVYTQLFCLSSDRASLISPFSVRSLRSRFNFFLRPDVMKLASGDINNDGIIDLPYCSLCAGHTDRMGLPSNDYAITWKNYSATENKVSDVQSYIYNFESGYNLKIPPDIINFITCYRDDRLKTLSFYKIDSTAKKEVINSNKIYEIKAFPYDEWKNLPLAEDERFYRESRTYKDETYFYIRADLDINTVYAASISTASVYYATTAFTLDFIN